MIWTKTALKAYSDLLAWYMFNKGPQFVDTIIDNVQETVGLISLSPSIGVRVGESKNKTYRSILTHPKTRIVYWYDEQSVHIVRLVSVMMNN